MVSGNSATRSSSSPPQSGASSGVIDDTLVIGDSGAGALAGSGAPRGLSDHVLVLGRVWLVPGSVTNAVGSGMVSIGVGAGVISIGAGAGMGAGALASFGAPEWPSDHALVLGRVWLDPGSVTICLGAGMVSEATAAEAVGTSS